MHFSVKSRNSFSKDGNVFSPQLHLLGGRHPPQTSDLVPLGGMLLRSLGTGTIMMYHLSCFWQILDNTYLFISKYDKIIISLVWTYWHIQHFFRYTYFIFMFSEQINICDVNVRSAQKTPPQKLIVDNFRWRRPTNNNCANWR